MLHVKGPLGEVLHTANFRLSDTMLKEIGECHPDYLYLDNTYIAAEKSFPS